MLNVRWELNMAKMDIKCTSVRITECEDGIIARLKGVDPLIVAEGVSDEVSQKMAEVAEMRLKFRSVRMAIEHLSSEVDYALSAVKADDKTASVASLEDIRSVVALLSKVIA